MPNRIIYNRKEAKGKVNFFRFEPNTQSRPFVEYFWVVSWKLKKEGYREDIIPAPYTLLVFEHNNSLVWGPATKRYTRGVSGTGKMCGIKFRPGAFRLFSEGSPSELTDNILPVEQVFDEDIPALEKRLLTETANEAIVQKMEHFLAPHLPPADPVLDIISNTVNLIATQKDILNETILTTRFQDDYNTFKKIYHDYVGLSVPTTIRCYRLQELAGEIQSGTIENWASFAMHMGYDDQAQFIDDFTIVNGNPPQHFAKSIFRK